MACGSAVGGRHLAPLIFDLKYIWTKSDGLSALILGVTSLPCATWHAWEICMRMHTYLAGCASTGRDNYQAIQDFVYMHASNKFRRA